MKILKKIKTRKSDKVIYEKRRSIDINEYKETSRPIIEKQDFNATNVDILDFEKKCYYQCVFSNVTFSDLTINDCQFLQCKFVEVEFINCTGTVLSMGFEGCTFSYVHFIECNIPMTYIVDSLFYVVTFKDCNLKICTFEKNAYFKVQFIDNCLLQQAIFRDSITWLDIEFINDKAYTKFNIHTKITKCDLNDNLYSDIGNDILRYDKYKSMGQTFRNFNAQFKKNGNIREESKLLYTANNYELKSTKGLKKVMLFIAKISCGYGENWLRSSIFSLLLILIYAVLYLINGLEVTNLNLLSDFNISNNENTFYIISYSLTGTFIFKKFVLDFITCIYFSMMTFTTVGYGNINTINISGMIISTTEMFMGAIMMSIMIGTIMRDLTRQ